MSSSACGGVCSSDTLFCGIKLTYFEFILSCIAIAADMITKDEPLLAKVCAPASIVAYYKMDRVLESR
jgi:hypothetical protein